jgi:hypothetical protein
MKTHRAHTRFVVALAVVGLALAAGPSGAAKSRIPELGDANPPANAPAPPTSKLRASLVLEKAGSSSCGTETFTIKVNGRRMATLC